MSLLSDTEAYKAIDKAKKLSDELVKELSKVVVDRVEGVENMKELYVWTLQGCLNDAINLRTKLSK